MNVQQPEQAFETALRAAIRRALGLEVDSVPLSYPPNAELGDLATPVCFELARTARRPPRRLAEVIVEAFEPQGGIARVEVAGGGYINAFLDRTAFLRRWLTGDAETPAPRAGKTIVEHTNINPNKAAHIGHLRNAVLGDTLVRCLRRLGHEVEVQNYIDDTGVQVADLVVAFRELKGLGLAEIRRDYDETELRRRGERFDYLAWDLYAEVTRYYEDDEARLRHREETLHAMEQGGNPVAELAAHLSRRIVQYHLETMDRIGVRYDLLPRESDILSLNFWADALERLQSSGAIHQAREGKNAGCWVMDLPGAERGSGEDQKIIVRSNGTVTYVGKDIAYQMWKFGLLERDFHYAPFRWIGREPPYELWTSRSEPGVDRAPAFGGGHLVYNVIDTRQSYLQRVVTQGLRSLGHKEQAERSIHFAYEMVALTPAAVQAMFPKQELTPEEQTKPHLEMSGRKGLGVRADDLVDTLLQRARNEVQQRNPGFDDATLDDTARCIGVGALRYYMLRFSRNRVVAFDLDDALSFEGETGPYLQYSVVRARNILHKVGDVHPRDALDPASLAERADLRALDEDSRADHWSLALQLARTPAIVAQAVASLELSTVAKHAYLLAQAFNSFYHRYRVAQESDPVVRSTRSAIVRLYQDGMVRLLELMGIRVPERM